MTNFLVQVLAYLSQTRGYLDQRVINSMPCNIGSGCTLDVFQSSTANNNSGEVNRARTPRTTEEHVPDYGWMVDVSLADTQAQGPGSPTRGNTANFPLLANTSRWDITPIKSRCQKMCRLSATGEHRPVTG